jgi:osmotically-inducible protein OsmY
MTPSPGTAAAEASSISETAQRRLRESPYFFLKALRCHFEGGVLTLRGRVPHGRLKQFAETIVSRIEGVREVVNRVEVFDPVRGSFSAQEVRNAG